MEGQERPLWLGFGDRPALLEQRSGRADLDALAAAGARRRLAPRGAQVGDDPGVGAAPHHVPGVGAFDLRAHADAARAQDAAVVVDHEAVVAGVDADRRVETGQLEVGEAERLGVVLQFAVVVGHAHRADVVALDEEHLDDRAAMVIEPSGAGDHVHAVGHLGDACRQRTLGAGDLDAAQPAGADVGEPVEMAQRRDVDAVLPRHVENRLACGAGDVDAVDAQRVDGHRRPPPATTSCTRPPGRCGRRCGRGTRRGRTAAC